MNNTYIISEYADGEVLIDIQTLRVISGGIPCRAHAIVTEWADHHRIEPMDNRERT